MSGNGKSLVSWTFFEFFLVSCSCSFAADVFLWCSSLVFRPHIAIFVRQTCPTSSFSPSFLFFSPSRGFPHPLNAGHVSPVFAAHLRASPLLARTRTFWRFVPTRSRNLDQRCVSFSVYCFFYPLTHTHTLCHLVSSGCLISPAHTHATLTSPTESCCLLFHSLQRIMIPIHLPRNPLFAPSLNMKVFDTRLGGMSKPLIGEYGWSGLACPVLERFESSLFRRFHLQPCLTLVSLPSLPPAGTASVPLADKLPWSPTFRPPVGPPASENLFARSTPVGV